MNKQTKEQEKLNDLLLYIEIAYKEAFYRIQNQDLDGAAHAIKDAKKDAKRLEEFLRSESEIRCGVEVCIAE